MPGSKKRTWHQSYQALVEYKNTHGSANVPQLYPEDVSLGQWVNQQRSKRSSLKPEQYQALCDVGFVWNPREAKWDAMYERLKTFKEKHDGTTKVPQKYAPDPELARWVQKQRALAFQGKHTPQRQEKLAQIGFDAKPDFERNKDLYRNETKFMESYWKLVQYYQEHGHSSVPQNHPQDPALGRFVMVQRRYFAQGKLTQARKELLDQLEFVWNLKTYKALQTWNQLYTQLRDFCQLEGHVNVPSSNSKLYTWVNEQRKAYQSGRLDAEKQVLLEALSPAWKQSTTTTFDSNCGSTDALNNDKGDMIHANANPINSQTANLYHGTNDVTTTVAAQLASTGNKPPATTGVHHVGGNFLPDIPALEFLSNVAFPTNPNSNHRSSKSRSNKNYSDHSYSFAERVAPLAAANAQTTTPTPNPMHNIPNPHQNPFRQFNPVEAPCQDMVDTATGNDNDTHLDGEEAGKEHQH